MKDFSAFEKPEDSMGLLLWQASSLWKREIKTALKPFDLTHTQFVILAVTNMLIENDTIPTQQEISSFSKIDVVTISSSLRLLEKKKYLTRTENKNDSRAKSVTITKLGIEALQKANRCVEQVDIEFFGKGDYNKDILKNILLEIIVDVK